MIILQGTPVEAVLPSRLPALGAHARGAAGREATAQNPGAQDDHQRQFHHRHPLHQESGEISAVVVLLLLVCIIDSNNNEVFIMREPLTLKWSLAQCTKFKYNDNNSSSCFHSANAVSHRQG